ncbi:MULTISPECIES: GAF domain-containing protein [unclassified Curtobacterium]|uniref:GAF domain-containing protein n=1 Tax=unclassified Curtobacterium TaxID=257496 RepID=UPI00226BA6CB|nr:MULTISPECIES: GAF domain-containing protein [unclassified Curtobacterium]
MTTTTDQGADHRDAVVEALEVLGSGPEERFDRITRMTQQAFGVPLSFLNLVHHDLVTAQSTQGWEQGGSVPASMVFCSTTVMQGEPVVVPDATLDPRFSSLPAVTGEPGIRFYAGAPLTMPDGTPVGTLCIMDPRPRELSAEDLALLQDLARWAERELGQAIDLDRVRRTLDGLVPEPVSVPGYDLDVVTARNEDGGDVADWRVADDGALHLTIGSVSAAGRAAGLLAANVRGALVARADRSIQDGGPGLEAQVAADLDAAGAVVSLFHARLDPESGHVEHVDAGHGLAVHLHADGRHDVLRSLDLPLGLHAPTERRATGTLVLDPGDRLVVFSEGLLGLGGIPDVDAVVALAATEPDGAAFGDRVRALLATAPGGDVTVAVLARR